MIKSEKDIIANKIYITHFIKFWAAFTYWDEGIKAIMVKILFNVYRTIIKYLILFSSDWRT